MKSKETASPEVTALLREASLRDLILADIPKLITAVGLKGHFIVEIQLGDGTATLGNCHGKARPFASLTTLTGFLVRMGCPTFWVDAKHYEPGRLRAAQPERSASMKAGRLPNARNPSIIQIQNTGTKNT